MNEYALIQVSQTLHNLERALIEGGGELPPELEAAFSVETIAREQQVDLYYKTMKRCESLVKELKDTIKILSHSVNSVEAFKDRLKTNVKQALLISGTNEFKGSVVDFKLSKGGTKLVIADEGLIPVSYFNERLIMELDKDKLKADLEAGQSIEGCQLVQVYRLNTPPSVNQKKLGDQ